MPVRAWCARVIGLFADGAAYSRKAEVEGCEWIWPATRKLGTWAHN